MNYKIIKKDAFNIVGKGIMVSMKNNEHQRAITDFWIESNSNGFSEELMRHSGPMGLLGVCMPYESDVNGFTYYIAAEKDKEGFPEGWEEQKIPEAKWAVFECVGPMPGAIQSVWHRIYSEWFPSSGYQHDKAPEIEVYPDGDPNDETYRSEIWIPVIKAPKD